MRYHHWSAVAIVLLGVGGCDAPDRTPPGVEEDDRSRAERDSVPGARGSEDESIVPERAVPGVLSPINQSGIRGTAELAGTGDGVRLVLRLEGLQPREQYAAYVHQGRCAEGGPVRLPLGVVVGQDDGAGSVRMRVDSDRLPRDGDLFVQVHDADSRPVACADLASGTAP